MGRLVWFAALLSMLPLAGAVSVEAQDAKKLVATDVGQVDDDFAFQGEYWGRAKIAENGRWRYGHVGLQVIARGGGKFDAVLFTGGLPGAGWNREDRLQLSGTRQGNLLRLKQGPLLIEVDGSGADITYPGYQARSRITKILRASPTLGRRAPDRAIVLFDGTGTDMFAKGRMTDDGLLMEGALTRDAYQNFSLHLEFKLPYMPSARGQGRANSGVYIQSRYEVQILDSFGLEGVHNECGGLYKQRPPAINMCFPPLRWQTYDLTFTAARFDDDGRKTANARITVRHNGTLIHDDVELTGKTGAGRPEGPQPLPTRLQDHGNPVRFRNIWLVENGAVTPSDSAPPIRLADRPPRASRSAGGPMISSRPARPYANVWSGGAAGYSADGAAIGTAGGAAITAGGGAVVASGPYRNVHPDYAARTPVKRGWYDSRPMPHLHYYGYYRMYPRPLHQHRQMEYNGYVGGYQPIDYYSPVPPDRFGYWTW